MIISLIVIIIAVVAVVSIGRAIFFGGESDEQASPEPEQNALVATDPDRSVRLTVRGPIVADENFKSYTIEASSSSRSMTVYRGYLDSAENSKSYPNNQPAYEQFVFALDKANMMAGTATEGEEDLRGICATGFVYEYTTLTGGSSTKRLWTSTCDGSKGTLDANISQLNTLFQKQIPEFSDLVPFRQNPLGNLQF